MGRVRKMSIKNNLEISKKFNGRSISTAPRNNRDIAFASQIKRGITPGGVRAKNQGSLYTI